MTNHLCNNCLSLSAFGWGEVPCDHRAAVDAAVRILAAHHCATLIAFGWDAPACVKCNPVAEENLTPRQPALVS